MQYNNSYPLLHLILLLQYTATNGDATTSTTAGISCRTRANNNCKAPSALWTKHTIIALLNISGGATDTAADGDNVVVEQEVVVAVTVPEQEGETTTSNMAGMGIPAHANTDHDVGNVVLSVAEAEDIPLPSSSLEETTTTTITTMVEDETVDQVDITPVIPAVDATTTRTTRAKNRQQQQQQQSSFLQSSRLRTAAAQVHQRMRERSQYLLRMHENSIMPQFTSKARQSLNEFLQRAKQVVMDNGNANDNAAVNHVRRVKSSALALAAAFFGLMSQPENNGKCMTSFGVVVMSVAGTGMGFISFLYFLSLGYAAALGLSSAFCLWAFNTQQSSILVSNLSNVHTSFVLLWAVRMFAFYFHREFVNWPQWHKSIKEADAKTTLESKIMAWMSCSIFYALMFSPCLFRMQADANINWGFVGKSGIALQIFGLALESIADAQKASFKARRADAFDDDDYDSSNRKKWCNEGIWKYSTHPNYLGESIFWIGTYLGGIGATENVMQRIMSSVGLVGILSVMKSSAGRLSASQWKNYKDDPEFVRFREATSILGPKYATTSVSMA